MITREEIEAMYGDSPVVFTDGYDKCIIGVVANPDVRVVYDADAMVAELQKDDMDLEEALEFMAYNIEGAHIGVIDGINVSANNPIYVWTQ